MIIRSYRSGDLSRMAQIWNEIVEEGAAFPQEELLDTDGARRFFLSRAIPELRRRGEIYAACIYCTPTTWAAAAICAMPASLSAAV